MLVNRDPDDLPTTTVEMHQLAEQTRQQLVHFICDEPGAKVGDQVGINFFAIVPFLPQVGNHIQLENGTYCEVARIVFKVARAAGADGKTTAIMLVPNVVAHLVNR